MAGASAQSPPGAFTGLPGRPGPLHPHRKPRAAGVRLVPLGINDRGQMVGEYIVDDRQERGFVRDRRGRVTPFDFPGARATGHPRRSTIAARSWAPTARTAAFVKDPDARPRSFLLDRGRFTRIDVPGATLTVAHGVNDRGQVVGVYLDAGGRGHGFLWEKGRFTTIDVPGRRRERAGRHQQPAARSPVCASTPTIPPEPRAPTAFCSSRGVYTELRRSGRRVHPALGHQRPRPDRGL